MWKKHKHLFLFPAAVLGILAVCWMSGRVSEFNKWYLIIAGTVGLYCWVSELVELVRERKKENRGISKMRPNARSSLMTKSR